MQYKIVKKDILSNYLSNWFPFTEFPRISDKFQQILKIITKFLMTELV